MAKDSSPITDQGIKLATFSDQFPNNVIEAHRFERCWFSGPAVIIPLGGHYEGGKFGILEDDPDSILWEIPKSRTGIVGAIPFVNCQVIDCTFAGVGFAFQNPSELKTWRKMLEGA